MYEDVLVATDGSEAATNAETVGISFARSFDATVHAVSIAERRGGRTNRDRRRANADALASRAAAAGCEIEVVVRSGRPASEILTVADAVDADVLVVGTHGRSALQRLLVGSVAFEVIRDARVPVLSVGPKASWTVERGDEAGQKSERDRSHTNSGDDGGETGSNASSSRHPTADDDTAIDTVCLATDGWSGSAAAIDHAVLLAAAADARLHLVYAVDVSADASASQIRDGFETHGHNITDAVAERAVQEGVEATQSVEHGDAPAVIFDAVAAADADLLVAGTEGKSTAERFVVGSVSQHLVARAPVPVLTVRTLDNLTLQ